MKSTLMAQLLLALMLIGVSLPVSAETLRLATSKSGWGVWLANELGYFEDEGLDISVDLVASGVAAGQGLLDGTYDVATMSGFAFVTRSFDNPELRAIGTVGAISNVRLIARLDHDVETPSDLTGKTIGLRRGSISEFFLGRLLSLHRIEMSAVTLVDVLPQDLPDSLAAGNVDAIVSWQPYAKLSKDAVGDHGAEFTVQGEQAYYFDLVTRSATIQEKHGQLVSMLRALNRAAQWSAMNVAETQSLLAARLEIPASDISAFWDDHIIDVALSQDMLFLMEEEAIWRIDNGYASGDVPDFLSRIDTSLLNEVDPVLVTIIR